MVDSKVFICPSAAELQKWMQLIEDRRYQSLTQPMTLSHGTLSYLVMMWFNNINKVLYIRLQLYMKKQSG